MRQIALLACAGILAAQSGGWQKDFPVDRKTLGVTGENPYFPLRPGLRWTFRHGNETAVNTVLAETATIDGVTTRVVEDRETRGGQLVELTRDYYAIDARTNDVYYFGEDVEVYRKGKVVSHEGSWRSGAAGAKFGLMMPGAPKVGQKFYQEMAPGVGMDRVEIVSVNERAVTPAGTFEKCLHLVETTPLEKGAKDHKLYAPGVGPVKDGQALLVERAAP